MPLGLASRAPDVVELMDDPDCDPQRLARTYALFPIVNATVGGWRGVYRRDVRPHARRGPVRLLDIGCGGADVARRLLGWAAADRIDLQVLAIDPDERAIAWAGEQGPTLGLELRAVDSTELAASSERFDVIISNHVIHHLERPAFDCLLRDSAALLRPGGVALHRDIARGRLAYAGFAVATAVVPSTHLRHSFIRADGLASIRRSFTVDELRAIAPPGWRVAGDFPARVELRLERDVD